MSKTANREVAALFQATEHRRLCVCGVDRRVHQLIRRRVAQGDLVCVARGMYARSAYWDKLDRRQRAAHVIRSMQAAHPNWTFCAESAGVLYGLPVSYRTLDVVHVAAPKSSRGRASASVVHHVVDSPDCEVVDDVRVTPFDRTVFDCMRRASFGQALAIGDAALRLTGRSPDSFQRAFRNFGERMPGGWHAFRTMFYADPRSGSGGESIARAAMIALGYALPDLQAFFPDPIDPAKGYYVDFLWETVDGTRVIGEFDGMAKYVDEAFLKGRSSVRALADEKHREARLSLYKLPIARLSYSDVMNESALRATLDGYGIPRSEEVARHQRRLRESRSRSALVFALASL